jgi:hypothetical protein
LVAFLATILSYFALAQNPCAKHTDPAFQASSPKTFRPGWQQPGLFLSAIQTAAFAAGFRPLRNHPHRPAFAIVAGAS